MEWLNERKYDVCTHHANQSTFSSTNQQIHTPFTHQSANTYIPHPPISKHINHSISKHINHSISKHINHSISKHINYSISKHINHSISKHIDHSISKHINHSISKHINHPISFPFSWSRSHDATNERRRRQLPEHGHHSGATFRISDFR